MSHIEIARQSARGSFALFLGNLLTTIISVVTVVILARLLGPEGYGLYTVALILPGIIQNVVGLGIGFGMTRYAAFHLSRGEADVARRMLLNGLALLLATGFILTIVAYAGTNYFSSVILHRVDMVELAQVAAFAVFTQTLVGSVISGLLGWNAMGLISVSNTIQATLRLGLSAALIFLGFGVLGSLVGYVVSGAAAGSLALALLLLLMRRSIHGLARNFASDVKTMFTYGFPLYLGTFIPTLSYQYLLVIMANVATNSSVGLYQSAVNVTTTVLSLITAGITQALFPSFASLDGAGADTRLAFRYAVKYTDFLIAPAILFLLGAAPALIEAIYSSFFSPASTYLILLAIVNIPLLFGMPVLGSYFSGMGRTKLYLLYGLTNAAGLLVFAPLFGLVMQLGISGLLYANLVANCMQVVVGLYLSKQRLSASMDFRSAGRMIVASLPGFAALLLLPKIMSGAIPLLVTDLILCSVLYLTVAPAIRAITADDLVRLESATESLGLFSAVLKPIFAYERLIFRLTHSWQGYLHVARSMDAA